MVEFIKHRVNTIEALRSTPICFGVEVDVRSNGNNLIVHHDPFEKGVLFDDWIANYNHGTLVLNVKEEGLEQHLIAIMNEINCENFFFLDQSYPFLIKHAAAALGRSAVRFSEYESYQTAISLRGQASWVWVDCFSRLPLTRDIVELFRQNCFKTCLVSPELQGLNIHEYVPAFIKLLRELEYHPNAICTKVPEIWVNYFEKY